MNEHAIVSFFFNFNILVNFYKEALCKWNVKFLQNDNEKTAKNVVSKVFTRYTCTCNCVLWVLILVADFCDPSVVIL